MAAWLQVLGFINPTNTHLQWNNLTQNWYPNPQNWWKIRKGQGHTTPAAD